MKQTLSVVVLFAVLLTTASVPSPAWSLSIVNLNSGYGTSLDDAYPVPKGTFAVQSALRTDLTENAVGTEVGRLRATHDIRLGVAEDIEFTAGGTSLRGSLNPATVEDPRSFSLGTMVRFYKQPEPGDWKPSTAIRVSSSIPFQGDRKNPTLKGTLVTSWNVRHNWWISGNVWYEVVPSFQPGQWIPARTSLFGVNLGAVKALDESSAVVLNVRVMQDPLKTDSMIVAPELGYLVALDKKWQLSLGVNRDFLGTTGQAIVRGMAGLTFTW